MHMPTNRSSRIARALATRALLGGFVALVACTSYVPEAGPVAGDVDSQSASLLATPCSVDSSGNVTLTINYGEIAYVGYQAGGGAIANAVSKFGGVCTVAAGKKIAVAGQGGTPTLPEKIVLDYTGGLFGQGLTSVTLDTAPGVLSQLVIRAPITGSNIALGTTGIDLDTTRARGGAKQDIALKWSTSQVGQVIFQGGPGNDAFIADATGVLSAPPAALSAWDTSANISKVVGGAFAGPLTVDGAAGNDVLSGGAGPNTLLGGPGDDLFPQSTTLHAEAIVGGDGWDTVDYSVRTAAQPVNVTLGIDGAVASVGIANPGSGYAVNDVLTLVGAAPGNVTPATVTVTAVTGSGAITGLSIGNAGSGYAAQNAAATTGGKGSGATVNVLANGIAAVSVVDGGLVYQVNDVVTITPASGVPATLKVTSVSKTGAIQGVSILTAGGGFSQTTYPYAGNGGPSSVSGGNGANASLKVTALLGTADDGCVGEGDSIGGSDGLGDNDVEMVIGGQGADHLDARLVLTDVVLEGGAGNDKLRGGAGRDDLCGGPGDDVLLYSGCSTSYGCSAATASGDFLSGSGGVGGGAVANDSDTADYSVSPTGVVVCLNPADPTCSGQGNPHNQNGAAAGQFDAINRTNLVVCPSARPFQISCNGIPSAYTPGAGTAVTSVATVTPTAGHHGSGFAVGDLVTIAGGTAGHLAVAQVTSVTVMTGSVNSLAILNSGAGYSAGSGNTTTATAPSSGSTLQVDITLAATGDYTCATSPAPHPQVTAGAAQLYDVANVTGHPTAINVMDCDGNGMSATPVPCTLVGGLAADTLQGSVHTDAIYGNGNGDIVLTNGGADLVDLTYTGVGVVESLDCNNNAVTVIYHANDTLHCRGASDPLGTYSDTSDQCTATGNTCHLAYFLPD
jgi:hypothetical protein